MKLWFVNFHSVVFQTFQREYCSFSSNRSVSFGHFLFLGLSGFTTGLSVRDRPIGIEITVIRVGIDEVVILHLECLKQQMNVGLHVNLFADTAPVIRDVIRVDVSRAVKVVKLEDGIVLPMMAMVGSRVIWMMLDGVGKWLRWFSRLRDWRMAASVMTVVIISSDRPLLLLLLVIIV